MMRLSALEIVGIAFSQYSGLIGHRDLESAIQDDSAFLAFMRDRMFARAGSWLVALLDQLNRLIAEIRPYLHE